jgi:hypothetical protein
MSTVHSRTDLLTTLGLAFALAIAGPAPASDHDDTPDLKDQGRHEARISDLHVFTHGDNLVIGLCSNPAIPVGATSYTFPAVLSFAINIDDKSEVRFDDASDFATYGGTIVRPGKIGPTHKLVVTFDATGRAEVKQIGGPKIKDLQFFAGLRDDPFIRGPRIGRNVGALVFEFPLASVARHGSTLLVWATSHLTDFDEPIADHAGRSLRSQFAENMELNFQPPKRHQSVLGLFPDVVIFDTTRPAQYPNGRLLTDDVVDLVGDARVLNTDAPFPSANDVPFLPDFPYLAPPH